MSKIMVVDDDLKILGVLREILQRGGYEVMVADSGEKCLEILKNEKPDLILMDVMMPQMDGWEVVKEIKKDRSNKDIIISMLTIRSEDEDRAKSLLEVSADWHIAKPVKRERLLETVHWLLTKS
jgi:two-component system alkaline phosphatase synthesis response regulator PhoP